MKFDITWTITSIIAVSSFLSPIFVACVNNWHHSKIRQLELEHDRALKRIDLQLQASIRQLDVYYNDKKSAFSDFARCASILSLSRNVAGDYQAFLSSIDKALLFCESSTQELLVDFSHYVDTQVYGKSFTSDERQLYSAKLCELCRALNAELELSKPAIESEHSKR